MSRHYSFNKMLSEIISFVGIYNDYRCKWFIQFCYSTPPSLEIAGRLLNNIYIIITSSHIYVNIQRRASSCKDWGRPTVGSTANPILGRKYHRWQCQLVVKGATQPVRGRRLDQIPSTGGKSSKILLGDRRKLQVYFYNCI